MIQEKRILIGNIPCLQIISGEDPKGVVVFYHGWSSRKEYQSLRGHILAAYNYDVLIPDAVNHGERGCVDYEDTASYVPFWQTIFRNVEEAPQIISYIKTWRPGLPLAVMGHSMGGFSAFGIMTWCPEYSTAVSMNGSGWWDESERRFRAALEIDKPVEFPALAEKIAALDPYTHTERLAGRAALALNGGADPTVDNAVQAFYMERLASRSDITSRFLTYQDLCHFVTTNMMDDAIRWIDSTI